ncbi:MAG: DNA-directed RNA polymerase subunit omega [Clostridia bacterium]|nr:DNA-directed RNA polymerase subunit omega [Clostridia bacterium]MBQ3554173.1 DNA-directed RNA polymerase subunit omega [Clostridia bacterium]
MLYPSIIDLMEKAGSRYSLVIAAAKRARAISEETLKETEVGMDGARSITEAVKEIADGSVMIVQAENNPAEEEALNEDQE